MDDVLRRKVHMDSSMEMSSPYDRNTGMVRNNKKKKKKKTFWFQREVQC